MYLDKLKKADANSVISTAEIAQKLSENDILQDISNLAHSYRRYLGV